MSYILNIDTALETAIVSLSKDGEIDHLENNKQRDHAGFLQPAIEKILSKNDVNINNLNAIAVSAGPGSYTGLRVGMASAKGLCYALNIPLILVNTLEIMALSAIFQHPKKDKSLFCPMIDARRMEVFTAVYDKDLNEALAPSSVTLQESSLEEILQENEVVFSGSGSAKFKAILKNENALFGIGNIEPKAMSILSEKKYNQKAFADLHLSEPLYIKDFYTI
jgi:tRNA threonylcarbamoyladenosine biosynthesis protein TsaB